ncbi:hypothetical protein G7066_01450 [Leucobacter coleopterorum]|uniref:DUF4232 domain-containing protein n=1 Tax=Leucobacter coleopterorum TaxID=2714933 RepID=A0ABX6JTV4_9MICO|nr:hypothetical protein [Leucobacter coleopterorum]QIM17702.1 hypothetical protein G7066_01450 [Leucobacter coleopterorum]
MYPVPAVDCQRGGGGARVDQAAARFDKVEATLAIAILAGVMGVPLTDNSSPAALSTPAFADADCVTTADFDLLGEEEMTITVRNRSERGSCEQTFG